MLLHFVFVLHFAAIFITFCVSITSCVSITFCGVTPPFVQTWAQWFNLCECSPKSQYLSVGIKFRMAHWIKQSNLSPLPLVLAYYNLDKPIVLQTDASDYVLGGALLQPNDKGKLQPAAFTSFSMSPTEQRYSHIEKECLAICNCFQKFDEWLYAKSDIEVHTDHQPLETILKNPSPSAKDADETATVSIQPNLPEGAHTPPSRETISDGPSTANISKSNTLRCLPNGDGVQRTQHKR